MLPRRPCSTLFPYTTLFRSECLRNAGDDEGARRLPRKGSAYVHVPQIEGRRTADDPFRECLTGAGRGLDRSEEHRLNSSHLGISYAVFCLKKKKNIKKK